MIAKTIEHVYRPHGGSNQLFLRREPEVLLHGPAGTGKSRGTGELFNYLAEEYPGCRLLVVRKTRSSLTESWMVTFENKVLPPDSPLFEGAGRMNRHSYKYPNGSEIVLGGMDIAERLFSTEYDVCLVVECTEISEGEWEKLHRALRNDMIPHPNSAHPAEFILGDGSVDLLALREAYDARRWERFGNAYPDGSPIFFAQLIGECNPDSPYHWLYKRGTSDSPRLKMIQSKHEDNPTLSKDYLTRLKKQMSGVDRERLYYGRWVAAEGLIWKTFDPATHIIDARLSRAEGHWWLDTSDIPGKPTILLKYFFASVDWGFPAPGVIQVWGVDNDLTAYMVYEIYQTERDIDWWSERAEYLRRRFDIDRFVCDPSNPHNIHCFNKYMRERDGHGVGREEPYAGKAKNVVPAGLSVVRHGFAERSIYFLRNALEEVDGKLGEGEPKRTIEEIPAYSYKDQKDGQPVPEVPDPACVDHGCDTLRYAMVFHDNHDWRPDEPESKYPVGSYAQLMGHEAITERWR